MFSQTTFFTPDRYNNSTFYNHTSDKDFQLEYGRAVQLRDGRNFDIEEGEIPDIEEGELLELKNGKIIELFQNRLENLENFPLNNGFFEKNSLEKKAISQQRIEVLQGSIDAIFNKIFRFENITVEYPQEFVHKSISDFAQVVQGTHFTDEKKELMNYFQNRLFNFFKEQIEDQEDRISSNITDIDKLIDYIIDIDRICLSLSCYGKNNVEIDYTHLNKMIGFQFSKSISNAFNRLLFKCESLDDLNSKIKCLIDEIDFVDEISPNLKKITKSTLKKQLTNFVSKYSNQTVSQPSLM